MHHRLHGIEPTMLDISDTEALSVSVFQPLDVRGIQLLSFPRDRGTVAENSNFVTCRLERFVLVVRMKKTNNENISPKNIPAVIPNEAAEVNPTATSATAAAMVCRPQLCFSHERINNPS